MIRIAICDDEKHMSDHIRSFVSDFFHKKNREISLRMFSSGEELLSYNGQIDILFLDIQMKDMDGMETARKLRANQFRKTTIVIATPCPSFFATKKQDQVSYAKRGTCPT